MTTEWWMFMAGILALGWSFWLEKREKVKQKDELLEILTRVESAKNDVALLLTEVEEAADKLVSKLEQITDKTNLPATFDEQGEKAKRVPQKTESRAQNEKKKNSAMTRNESRFKNKNEILTLWATGKPVDEIAASLGIGKGEVQLIVDLFGKEAGR